MERDGLGVFEVLVLVLAGAALLVVGVVWAGAALALLLSGAPAISLAWDFPSPAKPIISSWQPQLVQLSPLP